MSFARRLQNTLKKAASSQRQQQNTLNFIGQWLLLNALAMVAMLVFSVLLLSLATVEVRWVNPIGSWGAAITILIILNSLLFSSAQALALKPRFSQYPQWKKATFMGLLLGVPISLCLGPSLVVTLSMTQPERLPASWGDFFHLMTGLALQTILPKPQ